ALAAESPGSLAFGREVLALDPLVHQTGGLVGDGLAELEIAHSFRAPLFVPLQCGAGAVQLFFAKPSENASGLLTFRRAEPRKGPVDAWVRQPTPNGARRAGTYTELFRALEYGDLTLLTCLEALGSVLAAVRRERNGQGLALDLVDAE